MVLANSKRTHQYKPAWDPPRSTGTLSSPQTALPLSFVRCQAHLTLCELQATYKLTLRVSCRTVVSLLGGAWNSGIALAYVYRCSNTVFENTVFKNNSCSYITELLCPVSIITQIMATQDYSKVNCHVTHQSRGMASAIQLTQFFSKDCSWRDEGFVYKNAVYQ